MGAVLAAISEQHLNLQARSSIAGVRYSTGIAAGGDRPTRGARPFRYALNSRPQGGSCSRCAPGPLNAVVPLGQVGTVGDPHQCGLVDQPSSLVNPKPDP